MERTESVVVQVALGYENGKIQEMQMIGWNLQGRQEIHEDGDDYEQLGYVSLHFTRSLSLKNPDKVKHIEAAYFSLPFPRAA